MNATLAHCPAYADASPARGSPPTVALVVLAHALIGAALWHTAASIPVGTLPTPLTVRLVTAPATPRSAPATAQPAPPTQVAPALRTPATPRPAPHPISPSAAAPLSAPPLVGESAVSPAPTSAVVAAVALSVASTDRPTDLPTQSPTDSPARFDVAYLNNPRPDYPPLSRRLGEQGRVMLTVAVDASGQATEVRIASSSGHPRLDNAALAAVRNWRFVPAQRGGSAIATSVQVPLLFSLKD